MTANIRLDQPRTRLGFTPDKGEILPAELAFTAVIGKLRGQPLMSGVGFRHDHDTAGILIQTVNDAGTFDAANARQAVPAMSDQRVDKRSGCVACRRMNDQSGRFIDDNQRIILIKNIERDRFRLRRGRLRLRHIDLKDFVGFDPVIGLDYFASVSDHMSLLDKVARPGAAEILTLRRKELIEPAPFIVSLYHNASDSHFIHLPVTEDPW